MENKLNYEKTLEACVKACAKQLYKFTDEEILNIIERFKNVPPKVTMKVLTQKLLDIYKDSNNTEFQTLLNEIYKLNDGSFSSAQAIVDEIKADSKKEIKENHLIVNESIQEVCNKFNELGVDYYIVGALPVYLQTGKMSRTHEDIDFFVAEKDLPKVAQALASTKYKFHDHRLDSPRVYGEDGKLICGDHEVVADREDNPFHLGFFLFKREKDGSVTQREYHARIDEKGVKIPVLFERKISKEKFAINYGEEPVRYLNTQFRASTPESVYDIKSYMLQKGFRKKDAIDVEAWKKAKKANSNEGLINEERLNAMSRIDKEYPSGDPRTRDVSNELMAQIKKQQEEMRSLGHLEGLTDC